MRFLTSTFAFSYKLRSPKKRKQTTKEEEDEEEEKEMERRKLMCCVISVLGLLSAATGFAAEATRIKKSQIKVDTVDSITRCSFSRTPACDLGFTSALLLLIAQIIVSVISGCFCCRKGPSPSRTHWTISLVCFVVSWFTFVIAFLVLLAGAALNADRNEETTTVGNHFCYIVKPGYFSTGSVLSLVTVALGIIYYLLLTSTKRNVGSNQGEIPMGQPQIPQTVEEPVFVHEDTYMRRQFT